MAVSVRTIVELDLVGYSDLVALLEGNLGIKATEALNEQIHVMVDKALSAVHILRKDALIGTQGDGAILDFQSPNDAHEFAMHVHFTAQEHNRTRIAGAHRWFRVGITTGELSRGVTKRRGSQAAGLSLIRAVRLEGAVEPGQIAADEETLARLSPEFRKLYGKQEFLEGKRKERFAARRCTVVPSSQKNLTSEDLGSINPTLILGCLHGSTIHKSALEHSLKHFADVQSPWEGSSGFAEAELEDFLEDVCGTDFGLFVVGSECPSIPQLYLRLGLLGASLGKERMFLVMPEGVDMHLLPASPAWTILTFKLGGVNIDDDVAKVSSIVRIAINRYSTRKKWSSADLEAPAPLEVKPSFKQLKRSTGSIITQNIH